MIEIIRTIPSIISHGITVKGSANTLTITGGAAGEPVRLTATGSDGDVPIVITFKDTVGAKGGLWIGDVDTWTPSPSAQLTAYTPEMVNIIQSSNPAFYGAVGAGGLGGGLLGYTGRGTLAVPTSSLSGDIALRLIGNLTGSSAYQLSTEIRFVADGNSASGSVPGRIDFYTAPSGTVTPKLRASLRAAGGYELYNPAFANTDTDYERLELSWNVVANTPSIRNASAGTGAGRNLTFYYGSSTIPALTIQDANNGLALVIAPGRTQSTALALGWTQWFSDVVMTSTSGMNVGALWLGSWAPTATSTAVAIPLKLAPTINYSAGTPGAGSYEALKIAVTETALPTGQNYLIRASAGSAGTTDRFSVHNDGTILQGGASGQILGLKALAELTTIAAAATTDTAIQIPANAVVFAVSVRVTTVIPTAATFTVTGTTTGTAFQTGASVAVAAGTTDVGTKACPYLNTAAQTIRITPNAQPADNTGRVRVTIHYYDITAPTS